MNMATKILITLFFIATNSIAGTTISEEFLTNSQDMRLYQTESSSDDDTEGDKEEQDSTGTPTELILDTEPEC
ncbi:MAG: hypothetical protein F4X92_02625 [Gammaproteobacteria bacterium]|nr:hypothetical protein [Gammaproteobacteria bacterium]